MKMDETAVSLAKVVSDSTGAGGIYFFLAIIFVVWFIRYMRKMQDDERKAYTDALVENSKINQQMIHAIDRNTLAFSYFSRELERRPCLKDIAAGAHLEDHVKYE